MLWSTLIPEFSMNLMQGLPFWVWEAETVKMKNKQPLSGTGG